MKLTKRILSLCLALAMLLTVAAFPAFAEEYTPKTIGLLASIRNRNLENAGAKVFARPSDNIRVGDTLTIAEGQKMPAYVSGNIKYYFTGDTSNTDTTKQVTGWEIRYAKSANVLRSEGCEVVYVKIAADGTLSGFYASMDDTTPTNITFEEAGIYTFFANTYIDGTGNEVKYNNMNLDQYDQGNTGFLWSIQVKDANAPVVTAPDKADYEITTGTADILTSMTQDAVSATTGNRIYAEDVTTEGIASDGKPGDSTNPFALINAKNTTALREPVFGVRFDFEEVTYLEKFTIVFAWGVDNIVYDMYGSMNGEDWYILQENQTTTGTSSTTHVVNVDGVAQYFRLYIRDKNRTYGADTNKITAISGQIGVEYIGGSEEPTTVDVTFVDVDGANDDVVKTIDAGETVTIPDAYATGYKFYADEDCTEEITDLETRTFDANTTIYVKAQTTTPDPEQPTGSKTIGLLASIRNRNLNNAGAKVIARPSDNIRVGDTLTIAENQKMPAFASGSPEYYLTGDTSNTDTTKQVTGWKIRYAKSATVLRSEGCEVVYVKIAADGTLSGFYASMDDTTPTNITFEEAGIYTFASNTYIDGTGNEVKYNNMNLDQYDQGNTPFMWSIRVKEANAPVVTAPDKADYEITTGTADILSSMTQDAVSATTGNRIYAEDVTTEGIASDGKPGDNTNPFALINAKNTTGVKEPVFGVRFDFEEVTYLEKFTIVFSWGVDNIVYDMYGSMNGEDWYLLQENQTTTGTSSTTHVVNVDGVAQYFRLYIRDKNRTYGTDTNKITAISGQIGVEYIGGPEEPQVKDENDNVLFDEITDDVLATLPSSFVVSGKNYVAKSWTMDGDSIDYAALKKLTAADVTGDIVPELVEVPFDVALLSADATKAGEDGEGAFETGAKYVNGLYIQGAQIRFPEGTTTAGLRFVNVVDRTLEAQLEALVEAGTISGLDHGTLAIGNVNYDNVDLTVDNCGTPNPGVNNTGDKIYKTADLFNDEYYKYTLCVTGFQPEQYTLDVYVRPYITFTYGTETVYLYGEQYKTNYKAVVEEAVRVGGLSDDELSYCNGILG